MVGVIEKHSQFPKEIPTDYSGNTDHQIELVSECYGAENLVP